jgi:hypothetical protein
MPTVNIDNQAYDLADLSDAAKVRLTSLQFVDQELVRLQGHIAALKTARAAYVRSLQEVLPKKATEKSG